MAIFEEKSFIANKFDGSGFNATNRRYEFRERFFHINEQYKNVES